MESERKATFVQLPDSDYIPVIDSTNDEYKQKLRRKPLAHFSALRAGRQTQGRGRLGREWFGNNEGDLSAPDGNLYYSIILYPPENRIKDIGQISLLAGISLHQTMTKLFPSKAANFKLKWPNDLLLHDKKCAGILAETETNTASKAIAVILGTGINIITFPKQTQSLYPPTSLVDGMIIENSQFSFNYCDIIADAYRRQVYQNWNIWVEEGFAPLRDLWLKVGTKQGDKIIIRDRNLAHEGVFHDLELDGSLVIWQEKNQITSENNDKNGLRRFYTGDVL